MSQAAPEPREYDTGIQTVMQDRYHEPCPLAAPPSRAGGVSGLRSRKRDQASFGAPNDCGRAPMSATPWQTSAVVLLPLTAVNISLTPNSAEVPSESSRGQSFSKRAALFSITASAQLRAKA